MNLLIVWPVVVVVLIWPLSPSGPRLGRQLSAMNRYQHTCVQGACPDTLPCLREPEMKTKEAK